MTDTIRKAFEGWCSTVLAHYQPTDDATVNRRDWKVWQAATLTAKIPLEKRIAELESQLEAGGAGGVGAMPANAQHWHDLYHAECLKRQDDAARYGAEILALEAVQPAPAVVEPCGGCGEDDPANRCIGCAHIFWPQQIAEPASQWISVDERLPEVGRAPVLVAVEWRKYHENEDGSPTYSEGVDVTEGEYIPQHGDRRGYMASFQGTHGDSSGVTHWMPLPAPPTKEQS